MREAYEDGDACSAWLSSEFVSLDNEIHLLDHRKGAAEARLAQLLDEGHRAGDQQGKREELREVENEIRTMQRLHDEYVERIRRLREDVLARIDRILFINAV